MIADRSNELPSVSITGLVIFWCVMGQMSGEFFMDVYCKSDMDGDCFLFAFMKASGCQ